MIFIFDVDGTLTPSRDSIQENFAKWFSYWVDFQQSKGNQVWVISGSDLSKTVEQMGQSLVDKLDRCYNCMGNTLYIKGEIIYENHFEPTTELKDYLQAQLDSSAYPHRRGQHFEHRPGMINFSVVGRGAVGDQRTHYYEWDKVNGERHRIAKEINTQFTGIQAHVGGETGLDISYIGQDKSQIAKEVTRPAVFFGDRMEKGGNDYPLRAVLESVVPFNHVCHHVTDFNHTFRLLQSKYV